MKFLVYISVFCFIIFLSFSCGNKSKDADKELVISDSLSLDSLNSNTEVIVDSCDLEKILVSAGMINIHNLDSSILVDLKYSEADNFLSIDLYGCLEKAFLHEEAARRLVSAQTILKRDYPNYSIIIYDAVRPHSITQMMWDSLKVPENQKKNFLAHPELGSMHNYGLAVDVSVVDEKGMPLDMGTDFDSPEKLSYPMLEQQFLKLGKLTENQYNNRIILRNSMKEAGFNSIQTEWWHFSIYSKNYARENYAMVTSHIIDKEIDIIEEMTASNEVIKEVEEKISKNVNISFRVQILTSKQKIATDDKMFKGLKIYRYKHDGIYKYTTGVYTDITEAHNYQFKMWELGFKDAFVAGFNNNERIGIHDAIELLQYMD